jgi:hypothetical protein
VYERDWEPASEPLYDTEQVFLSHSVKEGLQKALPYKNLSTSIAVIFYGVWNAKGKLDNGTRPRA